MITEQIKTQLYLGGTVLRRGKRDSVNTPILCYIMFVHICLQLVHKNESEIFSLFSFQSCYFSILIICSVVWPQHSSTHSTNSVLPDDVTIGVHFRFTMKRKGNIKTLLRFKGTVKPFILIIGPYRNEN